MPVEFGLEEIHSRLSNWQIQMLNQKSMLYRLLAIELQTLARQSFQRLSQGSVDPDRGISWEPLDTGYIDWKEELGYSTDVGIRTGRMFSELNRGVTTGGFFVEFPPEYAEHFDKKRELLP